jgi:ABC-type phosphate/phosphonate transport system substrate-binding protein
MGFAAAKRLCTEVSLSAARATRAGRWPSFAARRPGSVTAVAEGRADLAAIDCVSFALLARGRPELINRVAVVAESPRSPSLPFIANARLGASTIAAVRQALFAALANPNLAEARAALGLRGARPSSPADYDRVAEIERGAAAAGYARLE